MKNVVLPVLIGRHFFDVEGARDAIFAALSTLVLGVSTTLAGAFGSEAGRVHKINYIHKMTKFHI
jgi:hypothetical protein